MFKLGMLHMESLHEIHGLCFWDGEGTVQLLEAAEELNAILIEDCSPRDSLRTIQELPQDVVIAGLLKRLW